MSNPISSLTSLALKKWIRWTLALAFLFSIAHTENLVGTMKTACDVLGSFAAEFRKAQQSEILAPTNNRTEGTGEGNHGS